VRDLPLIIARGRQQTASLSTPTPCPWCASSRHSPPTPQATSPGDPGPTPKPSSGPGSITLPAGAARQPINPRDVRQCPFPDMRPIESRVKWSSAPLAEPDSREVFRIASETGRGQVGAPGPVSVHDRAGMRRRQCALGGACFRAAARARAALPPRSPWTKSRRQSASDRRLRRSSSVAERELSRQGEADSLSPPGQRLAGRRAAKSGYERDTGARISTALEGHSLAAGLKPQHLRSLRQSPAPSRGGATLGADRRYLTFVPSV
jgi:hypothetical protein